MKAPSSLHNVYHESFAPFQLLLLAYVVTSLGEKTNIDLYPISPFGGIRNYTPHPHPLPQGAREKKKDLTNETRKPRSLLKMGF